MTEFKPYKYIVSEHRLIVVLEETEDVLSFQLVKEGNRKWINPKGINLDTKKEIFVTRL